MINLHLLLMALIMIGVTMGLRFLPFLIFGGPRQIPPYIDYLGKVLPYAIMGMLIVYCLRTTPVTTWPHGIPELIGIGLVTVLQVWKKNTLLSILTGTVCYMLLVQLVF